MYVAMSWAVETIPAAAYISYPVQSAAFGHLPFRDAL